MAFKRETKPGPALYYLSTPTRDHMPIFGIPELAKWTVPQLARAAKDHDAFVAGYCLLPSDLQALVAFRGEYDLAGFMYDFKWLSSRAIFGLDHGEFHERLFRRDKFRPWMNRFDQMYIGTREQMMARLERLHLAPVRKGLVSRPDEWPYSSAGDWMQGRPGLIDVVKEVPWID